MRPDQENLKLQELRDPTLGEDWPHRRAGHLRVPSAAITGGTASRAILSKRWS